MNERIKKLRKALDLTQQDFAKKIGSKRTTLATYETGRIEPSNAVISLICKTFNVNEEWLRNGTGEMFVKSPVFSLDKYAAQHGCTELERELLVAYFDLPSESRASVLEYFVKRLSAGYGRKTDQQTDTDARLSAVESQVEELREELKKDGDVSPLPARITSQSH